MATAASVAGPSPHLGLRQVWCSCGAPALLPGARGCVPRRCGPCETLHHRAIDRESRERRRLGLNAPAQPFVDASVKRCGCGAPVARRGKRGPLMRECDACYASRYAEKARTNADQKRGPCPDCGGIKPNRLHFCEGCGHLRRVARAERKAARKADRRSPASAATRLLYNTGRWKRLRQAQLEREPVCRMCRDAGRATKAAVCDHIEPHRGDVAKFWAGPFQSLCKRHHDSDKQRLEHRMLKAA
jgi:5-methylcytosine-specific restriction protein A